MTNKTTHLHHVQMGELRGAIENVLKQNIVPARSCLTCDNFVESTEQCMHNQHAGQRPPARIIAYGCALHFCLDQDIPF